MLLYCIKPLFYSAGKRQHSAVNGMILVNSVWIDISVILQFIDVKLSIMWL